ncbi:MAG: flagellar basal body P-ring protein FlgI [Bdellovibrionales bacterium]|nr:flagellar basal body P-ring protein FlgI [Bdellovibrionales bacterium]
MMVTQGYRIANVLLSLSLLAFALLLFVVPQSASAARLKDIADVEGVRGNQLVGYGLVVGLQGTGDRQGAAFTGQSAANMLERLGIRVDSSQVSKLANAAGVVVTAELPPFARPGTRLDVTISSLGDAATLQGGVLVMTPLKAADGKVYAVAQGPVSLGGFVISGGNDSAQRNHPTVARIAKGALVERSIPFDLFANGNVRVVLREPDFKTVTRVQDAINEHLGAARAAAIDSASVVVPLDAEPDQSPVFLIAELEDLEIQPDLPARVVVNERTGTIIMGKDVRVSTVALAHGNLNITIRSETQVSQPNALAEGATAVVQNQEVDVGEEGGKLRIVEGTVSLGQVVDALNSLGATPRDLIAIFQALDRAGALQAELVIM